MRLESERMRIVIEEGRWIATTGMGWWHACNFGGYFLNSPFFLYMYTRYFLTCRQFATASANVHDSVDGYVGLSDVINTYRTEPSILLCCTSAPLEKVKRWRATTSSFGEIRT